MSPRTDALASESRGLPVDNGLKDDDDDGYCFDSLLLALVVIVPGACAQLCAGAGFRGAVGRGDRYAGGPPKIRRGNRD